MLVGRNIHTLAFPRSLNQEEGEDLKRRLGFPVMLDTVESTDGDATVYWTTEIAFRNDLQHQSKLQEELNKLIEDDRQKGINKKKAKDNRANQAAEAPPPKDATPERLPISHPEPNNR